MDCSPLDPKPQLCRHSIGADDHLQIQSDPHDKSISECLYTSGHFTAALVPGSVESEHDTDVLLKKHVTAIAELLIGGQKQLGIAGFQSPFTHCGLWVMGSTDPCRLLI